MKKRLSASYQNHPKWCILWYGQKEISKRPKVRKYGRLKNSSARFPEVQAELQKGTVEHVQPDLTQWGSWTAMLQSANVFSVRHFLVAEDTARLDMVHPFRLASDRAAALKVSMQHLSLAFTGVLSLRACRVEEYT